MVELRLGLLLLLSLACTDKSGSDTGSTSDSGSSTAFTARDGIWILAAASISQDECENGDELASTGEENFLVENSDTGLDLTFEGSDPWRCEVSGNDLACPEQTTVEDLTTEGFDAVVSFGLLLGGTLTSSTTMEMSLEASYSCEGTECMPLAEVEDLVFPCTTILVSTARAQGS